MSARAGKRPMRSLSAHEKLDAIRRVHDGESKASVARDIGVPESTLRGWCKNEDKISYLSRQSSPDTDESVESQCKKPRMDDSSMQPFNLSLKSNSGTFSPNSETRYGVTDCTKNESDAASKAPLNLNTKTETPKTTSTDHLTERERNRAELARMSVELGLNRPEMFLSNLHGSQNLTDLTLNMNLLAQWNNLLLQQQQQQQKLQHSSRNKVTAPADTSTHAVTSTAGLLTTVDQEKSKHLPKEQQSVNESIWLWLKNQQSKLGLNQYPLTTMSHHNGTAAAISTSATMPTAVNTSTAALNGASPDQSSWFWKWYKQFAYNQQLHQYPIADKPILYQQLTKDASKNAHPQREVSTSDQHNAENVVVKEEKPSSNKTANNHNKVRSVLDNLLFSNNNNVAVNKKDSKEDETNMSRREALEHGEKFLKWLEACSDPSVTAMQIMQFKTLLNNMKSGAARRNGDQQNKTKVKRK